MNKSICNCCGMELGFWDNLHGIKIKRKLGYGSKYDGGKIELRICCDCTDKLIDSCKVNPITECGGVCNE